VNATSKAILVTLGAYVATVAAIMVIVAIAIVIVLSLSLGCVATGRALFVLWAVIAGVCIASEIVVIATTRRQAASAKTRILIVAAYIATMLASFVFLAFSLMVVFNC
jgi:hypothetical protein